MQGAFDVAERTLAAQRQLARALTGVGSRGGRAALRDHRRSRSARSGQSS